MEAWRKRLKRVLNAFEDTDDAEAVEGVVVQAVERHMTREPLAIKKRRGGSALSRAVNANRGHVKGHELLIADYFAPDPVFNAKLFRRRYRMPRDLFNRILDGVVSTDDYFVQKINALGVPGLSSHQKVSAALRMVCYDIAADATDEYLRLAESTAIESCKRFADVIIARFGDECLRDPTESDIRRHAELNAQRGFPGMFGSLDCTHWVWKNCPVGWQGMYQDRDDNSSVIMEAIATRDTWIWHHSLGVPGSNNDINVLDRSPLVVNWLRGNAPNYEFVVGEQEFNSWYLLTDGIYPEWSVFVKAISQPSNGKERNFANEQEADRKDVERCFGVIKSRFALLSYPCRFWDEARMRKLWKACIILHNMLVERSNEDDDESDGDEETKEVHSAARDELTFDALLMKMAVIQNPVKHSELQKALVENLWQCRKHDTSM